MIEVSAIVGFVEIYKILSKFILFFNSNSLKILIKFNK